MKIIFLSYLLIAGVIQAQGNQLTTLPDSKADRFELTDITWPGKVGDAQVCLWKDDRYAAVSITIDDNCKPDHDWWLTQCEEFGFPVTWFVITKSIDVYNTGFTGTWADYKKLTRAGNAVQSHTISHNKDDDIRPDAEVRREYGASKEQIEKNMPGNKCLTVAYPWGKGKPQLAADYYIAARGTVGTPNMANRIKYMNTCAGHLNNDMVNSILGKPVEEIKWLGNPRYRRGWITPVYHLVAYGSTAEEKQASIAKERKHLEYVTQHKDRLWIDTFVNVAKYGQERDSATLTVTKITDSSISLELKDQMKDDLFDYPLTVKVRLPDDWNKVTAKQNGKPVKTSFIKHSNTSYGVIEVIPDRGIVIIKGL